MSQEDQTALESLEAEARSPEAGLLPVELVIALAQSRAQAKEGRYQEAVSALHVTLRNAYERKALDRSSKGEWEEARVFFLKAAEHADGEAKEMLLKNVAICYFNVGLRCEKEDRVPQAFEAFTKATELSKSYAKAYYALAKLLARSMDTRQPDWQVLCTEAIAALRQAIAIDPSYRALVRRDTDFDPIRDDKEFLSL